MRVPPHHPEKTGQITCRAEKPLTNHCSDSTTKMDEPQNDIQEQTVVETPTENPEAPSGDKLAEALAQKKHWRDKAVDPSTGKTYKALYEEAQKAPAVANPNQFATKEDLMKIELQNMGYDLETVASVMTYAKGAGKDPLAVLEDPFVKSAVESKKAKARLEESIPSSSSKSAPVPLPKPYREMSLTERQDHFEKTRQKFFK